MSKINKFLYGGFAAVAIVSLVAMLVSVFSPPKQPSEETVETRKIEEGTAKSIEDAPAQMEQWRRNVEAARIERESEESEYEPTEEELAGGRSFIEELIRSKADRLDSDKAEKEWWESR